jgi:hypothetical protein
VRDAHSDTYCNTYSIGIHAYTNSYGYSLAHTYSACFGYTYSHCYSNVHGDCDANADMPHGL